MKKLLLSLLCVSYTTLLISGNPLEVKEYTLSNGLRVWINEDHSQPKVIGNVLVNAGAKDSPNTGIAHYFEHIMFKGTDKIGTVNFAAEKPLLDSISAMYDQLAETSDNIRRKDIQKQINDLSVKAAGYAIPNEFDRLISTYGGSSLNAGTSFDHTIYFNTFSPNYIEQWCAINSERLINPVFRGFQGELETVYEEKNMYNDMLGYQAIEKTLERFFAPHPYQYPVIGSAENLKNPRLSEMKDFFDTYYVAENMGLIISGDINAATALPVIERYFGKVRRGTKPAVKDFPALQDFNGVEKFKAKIPIPLVKINAMLWRGIPANHPDEIALKLLIGLLTNDNKTGLLDKLTIDGKVMQAMALSMSMNDAGVLGMAVIPNIPFQSYNAAQKYATAALDKIKSGDFPEDILNNLKLEQKRNFLYEIEKIDSRVQKMISLFSENKSWDDYLNEGAKIDRLTKQDIIDVANKYFTGNYLDVKKSTGKYPNERVQKPGFEPISPSNKSAESEYAKELKLIPKTETKLRFLDLNNPDEIIALDQKGLATLYYTPNEMNDIFTFSIVYGVGSMKMKTAEAIANYLNYLGTDSLTSDEFNQKLQQIGSQIYFLPTQQSFEIRVRGFDGYFSETLDILSHFIEKVKADKSKLSKIVSELKINEKGMTSSSDAIAEAMAEKVKYGAESIYLNNLTSKELKKMSAEDLLNDFGTITKTAFDIHYCGTITAKETATLILNKFNPEAIEYESENPLFREIITYNEPQIYFYNDPKSTQSIILGYLPLEKNITDRKNSAIKIFNSYFGGGMSSLMFQEIREFRSLAYRASSWATIPTPKNAGKQAAWNMRLSTQSDKTIDALNILDSIINHMPVDRFRLENATQDLTNEILNQYPDFRSKSRKIAYQKNGGYLDDENKTTIEQIAKFSVTDIEEFYNKNVKEKPIVYMIVGNEKNIDMKELNRLGKIIRLKKTDILKLK